jgi:hypothetical protein
VLRLKLEDNTDCIYAHPEVETFLITTDDRPEVMRKALDRLPR